MGLIVYPSEKDMKAMVCDNTIQNNTITLGAIKASHDIFSYDVPSLKRKTMRWKPLPVIIHYVSIPRQIYGRNHIIILVGGLFFNGLAFLLKISQKTTLLTFEYVKQEPPNGWKRP